MGEIRDRESMDHAVAFAETGHLCMATLHANSANQALDRIINFFPEERRVQLLMDLSLNLRGLVSQRLLQHQEGKGRVAAVEVMLNSPLISDLIFKGEVTEIKEIMKRSREQGMQTFDQSLFDLYESQPDHHRGCAAQCRLGERSAPEHQAQQLARPQQGLVGGHRAHGHRLTPPGAAHAGLAGRAGPAARPLARHRRPPGPSMSRLGHLRGAPQADLQSRIRGGRSMIAGAARSVFQ